MQAGKKLAGSVDQEPLRTSSCYCHIQMTASSLRHFLTPHAAGSRDRDARVWNTNNAPTTACLLTLTGHDEAVTCVHAAHLGPMGTGPGQMGWVLCKPSSFLCILLRFFSCLLWSDAQRSVSRNRKNSCSETKVHNIQGDSRGDLHHRKMRMTWM